MFDTYYLIWLMTGESEKTTLGFGSVHVSVISYNDLIPCKLTLLLGACVTVFDAMLFCDLQITVEINLIEIGSVWHQFMPLGRKEL
jgi:hypothetical protein